MPPPAAHDQRFLVVRTDRLGDVLLTLPMLSRIRASRPGARIAMLVRHYPGELLAGHPDVDELVWYDSPEGLPVPFNRLLAEIRTARFDTAIVVHPTLRLAWLTFRARIPVRVGTGFRYYSPLFTRKVYEHRRRGDRHELECNLRLLGPLGIPTGAPDPPVQFLLAIPDSVRTSARRKLSDLGVPPGARCAIVHPGSGGSSRDWPLAKFASLVRELVGEGLTVLITGSDAERGLVAGVVSASGVGALAAAGVFSLQELASVMATSDLFVGNSSGPLHLAVAMGTPVVGLYPQIPEIGPRRWGPYSPGARVIVPEKPESCRECRGRGRRPCTCMESIETDVVVRASVQLIRERAAAVRGGHP